ncbi:MAG: superinfection immunity protein [Ilumatobacteraceae bacterium]
MLPWAIAATRGRSNQASIGLINFFLGWSLIGWIVAMVMACQAHQVASAGAPVTVVVAQQFSSPAQTSAPPGWYPLPTGGGRYWDGHTWTDHHAP